MAAWQPLAWTIRKEGRNVSVPAFPVSLRGPPHLPAAGPVVSQTVSAGSFAGRLSMKELTENTACPGPGGP